VRHASTELHERVPQMRGTSLLMLVTGSQTPILPPLSPCGSYPWKLGLQRRPAKMSSSGRTAPVVSWTRTNVSIPIIWANFSLPIRRKKMFSL
jgi:hypothetical protein